MTYEEQLIAVKKDGYAIYDIDNPSEAVCLEAVKQIIDCKEYIEFTEKVQEYFISEDINNLLLIPLDELLPEFKEKYRYLLDMNKAGIL